jgi:DNA-binding protein HU-beta
VNKAELVEALAQHYDGNRTEAARALNAVVHTISASTAAGERVAVTGFGVFERVQRPARTVRNPRTGERSEAPATAVPRFRPGSELRAYVAGTRPVPDAVPSPSARRTRTAAPAAPAPAEPRGSQPVEVAAVAPAGKRTDEQQVATTDRADEGTRKAGTADRAAAAKGSKSKGAESKGAGKKAAGKKASGSKASDTKAAGKKASGGKASGSKAAGKKTAGKKAAGKKAAGKKGAGKAGG